MSKVRSIRLSSDEMAMIEEARRVLGGSRMGLLPSLHATMHLLLRKGLEGFFEGQACRTDRKQIVETCRSEERF